MEEEEQGKRLTVCQNDALAYGVVPWVPWVPWVVWWCLDLQ